MLFDLDGTLVKLPAIWEFFDELLVETLTEFNITIPSKKTRLALWHTGAEFENVLQDLWRQRNGKTAVRAGVSQLPQEI